jgi:hypothetical protein
MLRLVAPRAVLIWAISREAAVMMTWLAGAPYGMRWYFWDGGFYWGIAGHGYIPSDPWLGAYFPLYPLAIRAGMLVAPEVVAALVVSSLSFLAALIVVGWLANGAWAPMLLLAASPLAFFFTGMYADGLFVALVAGALLAYQRSRWTLCGVLAALSTVTRPFGLALVAALVIAALLERRGWRVWLWLAALPSLLLVCYASYLTILYHDPLEFAHVEQTVFGRSLLWPWQTVYLQAQEFIGSPSLRPHMLLDLVPVIVCAIALVVMARRWPLAWTLYVAFALLLMLITPVTNAIGQYALISAGRYTYAAVPVLLACATSLERWPRAAAAAALVASFALQMGLTIYVLQGGWLV